MKKYTTILMLFIGTSVFAQYRFTYDQRGLQPEFVVVKSDSLTQEELYQKSINWIKETFKNPDEVIKATIENEMIRFSGFQKDAMSMNSLGLRYPVDVRYTITIEFKEGRYKFEPQEMEYYVTPTQYDRGGWKTISLTNGSYYYRENGKERTIYSEFLIQIPLIINELIYSHGKYLTKKSKVEKSDW